MASSWVIGVDEAGRGPLAGPVAVGLIAVPAGFNFIAAFPGLGDSKMLTEKKREELYLLLRKYATEEKLKFCVRFSSHTYIDEHGMTQAVYRAIESGVRYLAPEPNDVHILLDGLLHAPKEYRQQTIINGDEHVPAIALASIAAKVRRDRLMKRMAKKFPQYDFHVHKGYATKAHQTALRQFGLSEIHRHSFCKNFV